MYVCKEKQCWSAKEEKEREKKKKKFMVNNENYANESDFL